MSEPTATEKGSQARMRGEIQPGPQEANPQPDLRTLEGQLAFLDYHAPDARQQEAHMEVNRIFQAAWSGLARQVPNGPGKTRLLHAMQRARMEANCTIANHGA